MSIETQTELDWYWTDVTLGAWEQLRLFGLLMILLHLFQNGYQTRPGRIGTGINILYVQGVYLSKSRQKSFPLLETQSIITGRDSNNCAI